MLCLVVSIDVLSPLRTAVSFSGQLGAIYLEFEWFCPQNGTGVLTGLTKAWPLELQPRLGVKPLKAYQVCSLPPKRDCSPKI